MDQAVQKSQGPEKEIDTIPELQDHLIGLKNLQGESALAYALQAQLQVLQVVQSPNLTGSMFDIMLESLYTAIDRSESDFQKKLIQQKAAIMVNSMVFFMEAKILYENKKYKKEGLDLLKKGCNMLADSASSIANLVATQGASILVDGPKLFETLTQDRTLIDRVVNFFASGKKIEQMQKDFSAFVVSAVDKLGRYKNLFGRSIVLAELVDRFTPLVLSEKFGVPFYTDESGGFFFKALKGRAVIIYSEIIILLVVLLVIGIMRLIDFIPAANLINARNWLWTIEKYGSLVLLASAIIIGLWYGISRVKITNSCKKLANYFRSMP